MEQPHRHGERRRRRAVSHSESVGIRHRWMFPVPCVQRTCSQARVDVFGWWTRDSDSLQKRHPTRAWRTSWISRIVRSWLDQFFVVGLRLMPTERPRKIKNNNDLARPVSRAIFRQKSKSRLKPFTSKTQSFAFLFINIQQGIHS